MANENVVLDRDRAVRDVPRLLEAGEVELAGRALVVSPRTILLRTAGSAGFKESAASQDVADETGAA